MRRIRLPFRHEHGTVSLEAVRRTPVRALAGVARDARLGETDLGRAVFFDTETTSLGGGVGTYVFLLGAGYFEEDAFVVEQYFMREVTEERALLHAISERFARFDLAVSFHGKGFDAPRLAGRFAFHRMPLSLPAMHLDLCIVGRSLYRGAFEDCRLQTFERELVRFERDDDLPGSACPTAYFEHLRGNSTVIPRVFEHNMLDVLTLPAVAARFAAEVERPQHPVVLANLGVYQESVGSDQLARRYYLDALEGLRGQRHPLLGRTLERLALLERRSGRHAESASLLIERSRTLPYALQPLEDLAKYYEHRVRDFRLAEATALDARSRLLTGKIHVPFNARQRHLRALDHRLRRLRRRLEA
jgi:uncharacterized protein YprB with RNaseH-like and TPR domain